MISTAQEHDLLPHSGEAQPEGIDLLAILAAFLMEWRLAAIAFTLILILGIGYTFSLKPQFIAQCDILPQAGRSDNDFSSLFSNRSPSALYIGLLQSRPVADYVIDKEHLMELFHTTSRQSAREALAGMTTFKAGGDSILAIQVRDGRAQDAARISNAYLDGLQHLNSLMSQEASRQTKEFFAAQLEEEKEDLNKAETLLEQTQKQTGIIQPETQTQIGLTAIATTRAEITNLEVQLASLLQSETEQNPQVQRVRSQLAQLRANEATLEEGSSGTPVGAAPAAGKMPSGDLEFTRAQREVRYHDAIVNALSTEFESARLSQDVSRPNFQIVDRAIVPETKGWPPRRLYMEVAMGFAFFMAVIAVALKLIVRRLLDNPENQASLLTIRRIFYAR